MDIIIRNGIIQTDESQRINKIKKEGLLKENYEDYIKERPGPYYDILNSHLCISRRYNQIKNFTGPQIKNKIKLLETKEYDKKIKYCCICHTAIKPNPAYSSKKKTFIDEENFSRKDDNNLNVLSSLKKMKISSHKIYNKNNWLIFSDKLNINNINNRKSVLDMEFHKYKQIQTKVIFKYYKIVYKLIKNPILYNISSIESKLLWPWELTKYQKFKLNNPNYKLLPIFSHNKNTRITENYVIIE